MKNSSLILLGIVWCLTQITAKSSEILVEDDTIVPQTEVTKSINNKSIDSITQHRYYKWDEKNNLYENGMKEIVGYTSDDRVGLIISYVWNDKSKTWTEHAKHEYIYVNNVLKNEVEYTWRAESQNWVRVKSCSLDCFLGKDSAQTADIAKPDKSTETEQENCPIR